MTLLRVPVWPSSSSGAAVATVQAGRSRLAAASLRIAHGTPQLPPPQLRAASSRVACTPSCSLRAQARIPMLAKPVSSCKDLRACQHPRDPPTLRSPTSRPFSSTPHPSRTLHSLPLADIGEGISEVEVLQWHVRPGSSIEEFQRLCEVQSDKASVEITSRYTGVVERLGAKEGEVMKVGGELCAIWVEEGVEGETGREEGGMVQVEEKEQPLQQIAAHATSEQPSTPARRPHPLDDNVDKSAALSSLASASGEERPTSRQEHLQTLATPAVRRLCRENDLDLAQIAGTGKEGRVTKEDVLVHLGRIQREANAASSSTTPLDLDVDDAGASDLRGKDVPGEKSLASDNVQTRAASASAASITTTAAAGTAAPASQPLTGIRKAMFKSLSLSTHIPHFTFSEELDVTELEALRLKINRGLLQRQAAAKNTPGQEEGEGVVGAPQKLTLLPFLLKALSHAMSSHPLFRSKLSLTSSSSSSSSSSTPAEHYAALASSARLIGPRESHDIAFALSTPSGLLTPVIRGVEERSVHDLARELSRLQSLARSPSGLSRADLEGTSGLPANAGAGMEGGTLILSNIGSLGCGTGASPVLPPTGELAIGAVCAVKKGFRWSDDPSLASTSLPLGTTATEEPRMIPRLLAPVTFAGDHRVLQGTELAAFVKEWKWWVEHPEMWVALSR